MVSNGLQTFRVTIPRGEKSPFIKSRGLLFFNTFLSLTHKNISIIFAVYAIVAPERERAVRALIELGAKVFEENSNKQTPRQKAESEGEMSLCSIFIQ